MKHNPAGATDSAFKGSCDSSLKPTVESVSSLCSKLSRHRVKLQECRPACVWLSADDVTLRRSKSWARVNSSAGKPCVVSPKFFALAPPAGSGTLVPLARVLRLFFWDLWCRRPETEEQPARGHQTLQSQLLLLFFIYSLLKAGPATERLQKRYCWIPPHRSSGFMCRSVVRLSDTTSLLRLTGHRVQGNPLVTVLQLWDRTEDGRPRHSSDRPMSSRGRIWPLLPLLPHPRTLNQGWSSWHHYEVNHHVL